MRTENDRAVGLGFSMARNQSRRPSQLQVNRRYCGAIPNESGCTQSGGISSLQYQLGKSSTVDHQPVDHPLRGEGIARQGFLDAAVLPRLSKDLGSSKVGRIPPIGRKDCGGGSVATQLVAGQRQQGKNQEHHERTVQSRNPSRVVGTQPNHSCEAEREASAHPGCS